MVYLRPYKETNLSLPDVNYKSLRRLPNLLIDPTTLDKWDKVPPLTDLTTDYLYEGAQAWYPHYSWHSDGRYILYAGEVVQNPPDKPPSMSPRSRRGVILPQINTVSISKASAPITMAGKSLRYQNTASGGIPASWDPDLLGLILRDANFLYINGHRLADPDSFRVLAQKSWDQRGKFSTAFNPCVAMPFGPGIPWLVHGPKS